MKPRSGLIWPALCRVYLPLSTPLLRGDHGVIPTPNSRAIGTSSCSTVRSSSEYSICSPTNADQPRKRAVTFASAIFQRGHRLLDRCVYVPVMQPVQVDVVRLQAAQRVFARSNDRLPARSAAVGVPGV